MHDNGKNESSPGIDVVHRWVLKMADFTRDDCTVQQKMLKTRRKFTETANSKPKCGSSKTPKLIKMKMIQIIHHPSVKNNPITHFFE